MGRKSSKTAHVLNLLTAGASDEVLTDGDQPEEELSVAKMVQKQPTRAKKASSVKDNPEPAAAKPSDPPAAAPVTDQPKPITAQVEPIPAEARPEPQPSLSSPIAEAAPPADTPAPMHSSPVANPVQEPATALNTPNTLHHLVNIAEYAIADKVDEIVERMNVCRCSLCKKDIVAAALNLVPVQYVLAEELQGNVLDIYLAENGKEVTAALVKACIKVKTNCRHR